MTLRFELYIALYLLIGVAYFLMCKKLMDEAIGDRPEGVQFFVSLCFVVGWPIFLGVDIAGFVYYLIIRPLRRKE